MPTSLLAGAAGARTPIPLAPAASWQRPGRGAALHEQVEAWRGGRGGPSTTTDRRPARHARTREGLARLSSTGSLRPRGLGQRRWRPGPAPSTWRRHRRLYATMLEGRDIGGPAQTGAASTGDDGRRQRCRRPHPVVDRPTRSALELRRLADAQRAGGDRADRGTEVTRLLDSRRRCRGRAPGSGLVERRRPVAAPLGVLAGPPRRSGHAAGHAPPGTDGPGRDRRGPGDARPALPWGRSARHLRLLRVTGGPIGSRFALPATSRQQGRAGGWCHWPSWPRGTCSSGPPT